MEGYARLYLTRDAFRWYESSVTIESSLQQLRELAEAEGRRHLIMIIPRFPEMETELLKAVRSGLAIRFTLTIFKDEQATIVEGQGSASATIPVAATDNPAPRYYRVTFYLDRLDLREAE